MKGGRARGQHHSGGAGHGGLCAADLVAVPDVFAEYRGAAARKCGVPACADTAEGP